MGYGPTDMIIEYIYSGKMCFTYDASEWSHTYAAERGATYNPWTGAYSDDVDSEEAAENKRDPRNPRDEWDDPINFDIEAVEAEIAELVKVQRDAGLRWIEEDFQVFTDGFITCDLLQAYSYSNSGVALSAREYIARKMAKEAEDQ